MQAKSLTIFPNSRKIILRLNQRPRARWKRSTAGLPPAGRAGTIDNREPRLPAGASMSEVRIEKDSMGDVRVPAQAYYGAQTQRAVDNFPISGQPLPRRLIHALGLVKVAAATANRDLGKLKPELAEPIIRAAREVAAGQLDDQFPIDVYQTGSGTSSNMNANEVVSN